jgi:NADH-quinone oxidoreductase subunit G
MHGPGETRFLEEKRHFEKPIALSELVLLDRERCIQCARCTRFAAEVAGEPQIDFAGRGEDLEVAAYPSQPFTSHYSGNTVQICPVGALTATPYRFQARPWDLDQVESTCTTCAVGCRVAVQSSANRITRLLGVDSEPVNHGWLCDKGRFAYEATNGPEADEPELPLTSPRRRLTSPMVRRHGELVEVSWGEAIEAAAQAIRTALERSPDGVGAIGGAALTNESQYLWARVLKGVVGTDNVDAQLGDGLDAVLVSSLPRATIEDAVTARTVLVLSGDLDQELPVLFLRLRGIATPATALVELTPTTTALTATAAASILVGPGELTLALDAVLGDDAAAQRLAAAPTGQAHDVAQLDAARRALHGDGDGVVVVVGRPNVAEAASITEAAVRRVLERLPKATFLVALRRGNVAGAIDLGLAPGLLPGRVGLDVGREWFTERWGTVPAAPGRDTPAQLAALANGDQRCVVLLGCDPLADALDPMLARSALEAAEVVVVGGHGGPVLSYASVVLPAAVAHERQGTTTNLEGRISRLGQIMVAPGLAWPDTDIAGELAAALGVELVADVDALTDEIAAATRIHAEMTRAALGAAGDGVVIGRGPSSPRLALDPIAFPGVQSVEVEGTGLHAGAIEEPADPPSLGGAPSPLGRGDAVAQVPSFEVPQPDAYSLRLIAVRRLYDRGAAVEGSPSLHQLIETATIRANPYDLDRIGASDGQEVRLRSEHVSAVLRCTADSGVPRGTLAVPLNVDAPDTPRVATLLLNPAGLLTEVRMESL